jgi:hypothetical protein
MFWVEDELRDDNLTVRRLADLTPGEDTGATPFAIFTGGSQRAYVRADDQ